MSLAPASSRGAFLKARLAVNGIQCAARSLGTLTAAERGLLSSMAGLLEFSVNLPNTLAVSLGNGNVARPTIFAGIERFSGHARTFSQHCSVLVEWICHSLPGAAPSKSERQIQNSTRSLYFLVVL